MELRLPLDFGLLPHLSDARRRSYQGGSRRREPGPMPTPGLSSSSNEVLASTQRYAIHSFFVLLLVVVAAAAARSYFPCWVISLDFRGSVRFQECEIERTRLLFFFDREIELHLNWRVEERGCRFHLMETLTIFLSLFCLVLIECVRRRGAGHTVPLACNYKILVPSKSDMSCVARVPESFMKYLFHPYDKLSPFVQNLGPCNAFS